MMIPEKVFASFPIMTVTDLLQLHSVREKLIFSQFSGKDNIKHLLDLQLLHLYEYAELTGVVTQNDKLFIGLIDKISVGIYPKDVMHMYAENEPTVK